MTRDNKYPKGTRKLVEIEFLEDTSDNDILTSIFKGTPLNGGTYKVNKMYFDTIDKIKEKIKDSIIETVDRL